MDDMGKTNTSHIDTIAHSFSTPRAQSNIKIQEIFLTGDFPCALRLLRSLSICSTDEWRQAEENKKKNNKITNRFDGALSRVFDMAFGQRN